MRLSRVRFTIKRMMLTVAGVAVALAYLGTASTTRLGCGSATILLTLHVVDDRDGRPVDGATIELSYDYSAPPTVSVITGAGGYTRANWKTGATWYSGPFFRQYRCLSYCAGLRIKAEGYQTVDALIREYTAHAAYHDTPTPPPILVRLKKAHDAKSPHT